MYRQYILKELDKFLQERYPQKDLEGGHTGESQLTFGQIIHSTISNRGEKNKSATEWLYSASDEDFFTAMQNAIEYEQEN